MINSAVLQEQAVPSTDRLRLEQLGPQHFSTSWASLQDEEGRRLTGTHQVFTEEMVRTFLTGLPGRKDRADWAVVRSEDGAHIGDVVLNDLDEDNQSMNFRIALAGPEIFGRGYGTEATRAVIEYAFETVGLHRLSLGVYAFNSRAQRVYEKVGFIREGVSREALNWGGQWYSEIMMGMLASDPRP